MNTAARKTTFAVTAARHRLPMGQNGFTMVEMLIAILIFSIVSISIYSVYNIFFRHATTQDLVLESQQNARAGINIMERELVNAGYAAGTTDIITEATSNSIEFTYTDPQTDSNISSTAGKRMKVKYALQTVNGVQYLTRTQDILTESETVNTEKVIPDVQGLAITYYDINGDAISDTSTQTNRNNIKSVKAALTTRTSSSVPGGTTKTFEVDTTVRLRNIGIGQVAQDSSAPAAPTGVQVRDPGLCARLKVKWTKNSEGDIYGYKIYYGTATANYTGVINVPLSVMSGSGYSCTTNGNAIECTINPSSPSLSTTMSNTAPGSETIYYLAIKAYDNSLNYSAYSTEVSGNPGTSNPTFDSGVNDSAINPAKPATVTGLIAANGASDGQVGLNWSGYNTSSYPDVTGFRIYRSDSPFASYPIDPNAAGIDWIAGEPGSGKPEVSASATSYTDVGPGLVGCRIYYYAMAPVNCDTSLITDEGGDPASKKYVQTNYAATCGDGTNSCSAGTGFSSVSGSDSAPTNTTPPSAPALDVRAGWKRVALSLTQPSDSDLSQTCVYSREGASYPALLATKDAVACWNVSSPGIRLYESGGVITTSEVAIGGSTSFWHNSMTSLTTTPSLAETGTYSYSAVAFDLCGNGSNATDAQATTTLCGEDPQSGEKPPAVTSLTASCCEGPVSISWTGVSSDISLPSTPTNPYDLAGYRIFRSTSSSDWSAATLLTSSAPFWGASYSDTTASEGGTYYYRVVSTDCPYEKNNPAEASIRSDMISGVLNYTQVGPVKPGKIDRDEKCAGGGSCTKDDHREVLTGVEIDNDSGTGTGATTPKTSFTHNRAMLFFGNTGAGDMTVTGISVNWVNSGAYLRQVKIGGGRSGVGAQSTDIAAGSTTVVSGNSPYTRGVSNITLTSTTIPGGTRYVPLMLKFLDASGSGSIDMRDDQLLITLNIRNDSTGTTSCLSYVTISRNLEGIYVPFGPSVTASQQNQPSSPTFSYAVPGSTGLNTVPNGSDGSIVVDSGVSVTISASVTGVTTDEVSGGKIGVSSVKLYYIATAKTTTTAPASGYTEAAMTNTSGDIWSATIPNKDNQRVWYYIVAIDNDGNWDRDPEIAYGAYVYDQKNFNVCDVTPSAPTSLTATAQNWNGTTGEVLLSWTAPATYTNGNTIDTGADPIKHRVYKSGTQVGGDIAGTTYTDAALSAGVYNYTVKAINSCASPGPNVSAASSIAASCVGSSGQATLSVSPTSIYRGQSYTVTIVDCLAISGANSTTTEVVNQTSGYTGFKNQSTAPLTGSINPYSPTITESGPATGTFTKTITTTGDVSDTDKLLTLTADTVTVTYPYASPTTKTVSVVVDPCTNTPKAPTGAAVSVTGQNMTVSWTAVTQNTDDSAITDLAGYRVYEKVCADNKPDCTGADIVRDWFVRTTVTSGTSVTVDANDGQVNKRIYYFKVRAIDNCTGGAIESGDSNVVNENS